MKTHILAIASILSTLSPAVAISTAMVATPAAAQGGCNLDANKLSHGWTCQTVETVKGVSRTIGNGKRCQDAYTTVISYLAYNPGGQHVSDFDGEDVIVGDQSDWGPSYWKVGSCNFD